jgi:hypothetical protein
MPAAKIQIPGLESDEEGLDALEPEQALGKVLKQLQDKQYAIGVCEGTLRLLDQLPDLPDDTPVSGDNAHGVFEDLLNALPEEEEGADIEDSDFLTDLGIPEDEFDEPYGWHGWTAGMVRKGLAELAYSGGMEPEKLLAKALKKRRAIQDLNTDEVQQLRATVKVLGQRIKAKAGRLKRERMLPETHSLQKITRYEVHLSRQLLQALHELQRLQAARGGQTLPLPAALDVVVTGASGEDVGEVFEAAEGMMDE